MHKSFAKPNLQSFTTKLGNGSSPAVCFPNSLEFRLLLAPTLKLNNMLRSLHLGIVSDENFTEISVKA